MGDLDVLTDPTYFGDEGDDESRAVAGIVSPSPASALVPPPPDIAPRTAPGVTTPQTGSIAGPAQHSVAKNLDTVAGRQQYSGVSNPPGGGYVNSIQAPAQENRPTQPLQPAQPMQPAQRLQPASIGTGPGGVRTVIRDLAGNPAGSPLSALSAQGPVQPANGMLPLQPGVPLATQQANRMQAYNAGPGPAQYAASQTSPSTDPLNPDPNASLRPGGTNPTAGTTPLLPATQTGLQPANPPSQLDIAESRLNNRINQGSGIDQIKNPWGRGFAQAGDTILRAVLPGVEPLIPKTQGNYQMQVGNLQAQAQAAANLANTQSQQNERDAMGRRYDAQANFYNPEPLSAGQAQALGHPEWEGLKLDARDAERLVGGAARNQTTLQTHFGGQQRTLSADDAEAIGTPSLEGANMSNDEYQRLLQGAQHNQQWDTNNQRTTGQSDVNNQRNNATRITTTGMRDDTSAANSERIHPGGGGAPKPIPAGVRDRIESQKATAINKARAQFDSGESSQDEYLDNWQQAQNEYEERIQAQTGQPVEHLDIRSNVDSKGNWIGKTPQPAGTQPQTQPGKPGSFVTRGGNRVAVGDPVKVGGRTGKVTGFNPRSGKAQVQWDSRN